ncbi:hypothetical protein ACP4OV_030990 [Aristida adscensionis]
MGGRKRAVLVGINYGGTKDELRGCHNDVARMRRCLLDRFGFDDADIRVLVDAGGAEPPAMPTGANIRGALERLVADARPGDALFFHFSGHGNRMPAETGDDDDTGFDECITPCDHNPIQDQDLKEIVAKVPDGCRFTIVLDSCHSGGMVESTKEQIGSSTRQRSQAPQPEAQTPPPFGASLLRIVRGMFQSLGVRLTRRGGLPPAPETKAELMNIRNRSLPLPSFIEMLRERTGRDDVGVGSIRTTLFRHFGDDASPKVKAFVQAMAARLRQGGGEPPVAVDTVKWSSPEQEARSVELKEVHAGTPASVAVPRNGVLISGCQTDQSAADATAADGTSYGALSNAIQAVLAGKKHGTVSNRELVLKARELLSSLAKQGVTQQPGLYCSDELADLPFIC